MMLFRSFYIKSLTANEADAAMPAISTPSIGKTDEKFTTNSDSLQIQLYNSLGGELANKLPVFVPPVNTHAPVVLAAFSNPFRISFMEMNKIENKKCETEPKKSHRGNLKEKGRKRMKNREWR